jgi:hypothetical protein
LWVLERVRRYPKPWQTTLGLGTAESALSMTLLLLDAAYRRDKVDALRRANAAAQRLRLLLRMATDLRVLSPKQLEYAASGIDEVGRMIGGWLRHQEAGGGGRDVRADRELREPPAGGPRGGEGQETA